MPNVSTTAERVLRGKRGFARGSIKEILITRTRKNGKVWQSTQFEYRWQDSQGKHRRYLSKAIAPKVRADWEAGMTAKEITCKYNLVERKR